MDLLLCSEEMMEATPEGAYAGPGNWTQIEARKKLDNDLDFSYMDKPIQAHHDSVLVRDSRVLPEMFRIEEKLQSCIQPNYFKTVQWDISPRNRAAVTTWMFEVCEEERLQECIFLRAVSYVDRVLSASRVECNQLQLLGATCLFLSCKWTGITFPVEKVVHYTANSCSRELIMEWEIMVVHSIKWDLAVIVPSDFVQHFKSHLPKEFTECWTERTMEKIKTLMAYSACDPTFIIHTPSIIAASAMAAAASLYFKSDVIDQLLHHLQLLSNIEKDVMRSCMEQMKMKVAGQVKSKYYTVFPVLIPPPE